METGVNERDRDYCKCSLKRKIISIVIGRSTGLLVALVACKSEQEIERETHIFWASSREEQQQLSCACISRSVWPNCGLVVSCVVWWAMYCMMR